MNVLIGMQCTNECLKNMEGTISYLVILPVVLENNTSGLGCGIGAIEFRLLLHIFNL